MTVNKEAIRNVETLTMERFSAGLGGRMLIRFPLWLRLVSLFHLMVDEI